ncbi:MAG: TIGR02302 family protein, partial [Proteobacteria bacterium]|nr:TIGR02302 family protein [Pseudomonadota bacterium]
MSTGPSESETRRQPVSAIQQLLKRRIAAARVVIAWERLWLALWPTAGVVGVFLALSLSGMWSLIPGWLHVLALAGFAAALCGALWRAFRAMRWPSQSNAERRLETVSGLAHRPMRALYDEQGSGIDDPGSQALWQTHRRRMIDRARQLRSGWPHPGLARRDPFAVRAIVGLLLTIGIVTGAWDAGPRLLAAFNPDFSAAAGPAPSLEAWITPPEYTRHPPIFLTAVNPQEKSQTVLAVPVGSTFLAQLSGSKVAPSVALDADITSFTAIDTLNFRAEIALNAGSKLTIRRGENEVASWSLSIIPDTAPAIAFADKPKASLRKALELAYQASDDYGLSWVRSEISRTDSDETIELELPLAGQHLKKAAEASFHDLTPHAWAGFKVTIQLVASDAIDQRGRSEKIEMVLPERDFTHPVARALIEQRKILTRQPEHRERVVTALRALSLIPEKYENDSVVHLALRTAQSRLKRDDSSAVTREVQTLLWDTALRLEDGNLSLAQARLRDAQQALMDALARDAPDEEIQRLMNELKQAMERYLQALSEQAIKQAERGEQGLDPNALQVQELDLAQMLERARELSQMGAKDAARQLLSQLQNMLENLRAGVMMNPLEQSTQQALRGMNQLMRQQQQLLDQTFRSDQKGRPQPGESFPGMGQEQEALRRMLGDIMRQLGETGMPIPNSMGRAERSMRAAREA